MERRWRLNAGEMDGASAMSPFVSEINIYPVKSLKGVSLTSAPVQHRGLQYDRRWTLAQYRSRNQKVIFGMFTIPMEEGAVRVGDGVEVLE